MWSTQKQLNLSEEFSAFSCIDTLLTYVKLWCFGKRTHQMEQCYQLKRNIHTSRSFYLCKTSGDAWKGTASEKIYAQVSASCPIKVLQNASVSVWPYILSFKSLNNYYSGKKYSPLHNHNGVAWQLRNIRWLLGSYFCGLNHALCVA